MFKSPLMSDVSSPNSDEPPPLPKRGRSSEDFLSFCKLILDYENYDGELVRQRHTSSPLGSTGDSSLSSFHEETYHDANHHPHHHHHTIQDISDGDTMTDDFDDDEAEITCYCRKPYGGRPMIECSSCQTWVHLTCAKVRRSNIPETWYCRYCRGTSAKSSKGGAKSRARKPEHSRTTTAAAAVILTKNKRRLWSSARPLDLCRHLLIVSLIKYSLKSHFQNKQTKLVRRDSEADISTEQYKPWTDTRHNITRLADINKHWTCDCSTNYIIKCLFQFSLYQNKTWNTAVRGGGGRAPYLPETTLR